MNYGNIIVEKGDDSVAKITLNRPSSLNTFNIPLAKELNQAIQELDEEKQVRVIILKGASKAFCAAADLDYYKAFEHMNEAFADLCATENAKEGISAFMEKRSPAWKQK